MKNSIKIIGLVIVFIGSAVAGYLIPKNVYAEVLGPVNLQVDVAEPVKQAESPKPTVKSTASEQVNKPVVADVQAADSAQDQVAMADSVAIQTPQPVEVAEVPQVSGMPMIVKVTVGGRSPKEPKRVGYPLTVLAQVETGAELECEVRPSKDSGEVVAKKVMTNGKVTFKEIKPIDGGAYYICVRNMQTGEEIGAIYNGFSKIGKWGKDELTRQLNADNMDKYFYFHFDTDKLKFDCAGVDDGLKPKTLDGLRTSCRAYGWNMEVTETPKYDEYNRIVYFKVQIIE